MCEIPALPALPKSAFCFLKVGRSVRACSCHPPTVREEQWTNFGLSPTVGDGKSCSRRPLQLARAVLLPQLARGQNWFFACPTFTEQKALLVRADEAWILFVSLRTRIYWLLNYSTLVLTSQDLSFDTKFGWLKSGDTVLLHNIFHNVFRLVQHRVHFTPNSIAPCVQRRRHCKWP